MVVSHAHEHDVVRRAEPLPNDVSRIASDWCDGVGPIADWGLVAIVAETSQEDPVSFRILVGPNPAPNSCFDRRSNTMSP